MDAVKSKSGKLDLVKGDNMAKAFPIELAEFQAKDGQFDFVCQTAAYKDIERLKFQ